MMWKENLVKLVEKDLDRNHYEVTCILRARIVLEKFGIDVTYIPLVRSLEFIVFSRDDLSASVEGRPIEVANLKSVVRLFLEM